MADLADTLRAAPNPPQQLNNAYKDLEKQQNSLRESSLRLSDSMDKISSRANKVNKVVGLMSQAYRSAKDAIRQYGVEVSAVAASLRIFHLQQRDTTTGVEAFYKTSAFIPQSMQAAQKSMTQAGKAMDKSLSEKAGDLGTTIKTRAMGSLEASGLGDSVSAVFNLEFKKAYAKLQFPDFTTAASVALTGMDKATAKTVHTQQQFFRKVSKDAAALAVSYNKPTEEVRNLSAAITGVMRQSTKETGKYSESLKNVADNILFAAKVSGVDEAEALSFVDRSMWKYGISAEAASKQLAQLHLYVEANNASLIKEGLLTADATDQWKDDFSKAVLEAVDASEALFLQTGALAKVMAASQKEATKMGLAYEQTQTIMKGIPKLLGSTPDYMKVRIGQTFLDIANDSKKLDESLSKIQDPGQRAKIKANIEMVQRGLKEGRMTQITAQMSMYDVIQGTGQGIGLILGQWKKLGDTVDPVALMRDIGGVTGIQATAITEMLQKEKGGLEDAMKYIEETKGKEGGAWDEVLAKQKPTIEGLQTSAGLVDRIKRSMEQIGENEYVMAAVAAAGGVKQLFNRAFGRGGGGGGAEGGGMMGEGGAQGPGIIARSVDVFAKGAGSVATLVNAVASWRRDNKQIQLLTEIRDRLGAGGPISRALGGGGGAGAPGWTAGGGRVGKFTGGLRGIATAAAVGMAGEIAIKALNVQALQQYPEVAKYKAEADKTLISQMTAGIPIVGTLAAQFGTLNQVVRGPQGLIDSIKQKIGYDVDRQRIEEEIDAKSKKIDLKRNAREDARMQKSEVSLEAEDIALGFIDKINAINPTMWIPSLLGKWLGLEKLTPRGWLGGILEKRKQARKEELSTGVSIAKGTVFTQDQMALQNKRIKAMQGQAKAISAETVATQAQTKAILANVPQAQTGAIVEGGGLVNVHPAEVIVPQAGWQGLMSGVSSEFVRIIGPPAPGSRAPMPGTRLGGRMPSTAESSLALKASVDNMGKLTLVAEDFFDVLSSYDTEKERKIYRSSKT